MPAVTSTKGEGLSAGKMHCHTKVAHVIHKAPTKALIAVYCSTRAVVEICILRLCGSIITKVHRVPGIQ